MAKHAVASPATDLAPAGQTKQSGLASPKMRMAATALLLVSMIVFWIILLAGTAAGQHTCADSGSNSVLDNDGDGRCITYWSLPWWVVWFQFLLIGLAVAAAVNYSIRTNFGISIAILFAIQTALLMLQNGELNTRIEDSEGAIGLGKRVRDALRCMMAGSVVLTILNLLYIFWAASRHEDTTPCLKTNGGASGSSPARKDHTTVVTHMEAAPPMTHVVTTGATTPTYHPTSPVQTDNNGSYTTPAPVAYAAAPQGYRVANP